MWAESEAAFSSLASLDFYGVKCRECHPGEGSKSVFTLGGQGVAFGTFFFNLMLVFFFFVFFFKLKNTFLLSIPKLNF